MSSGSLVENRSLQFSKIVETDYESTNTVQIDPALLTKHPDSCQSFEDNILIVSVNNGILIENKIEKNEDMKVCENADISLQTG